MQDENFLTAPATSCSKKSNLDIFVWIDKAVFRRNPLKKFAKKFVKTLLKKFLKKLVKKCLKKFVKNLR